MGHWQLPFNDSELGQEGWTVITFHARPVGRGVVHSRSRRDHTGRVEMRAGLARKPCDGREAIAGVAELKWNGGTYDSGFLPGRLLTIPPYHTPCHSVSLKEYAWKFNLLARATCSFLCEPSDTDCPSDVDGHSIFAKFNGTGIALSHKRQYRRRGVGVREHRKFWLDLLKYPACL